MGPNHLFAISACAAGALLLLGWTYLTTANPRSNRMLAKSLFLFVLPGAGIVALPDSFFLFPASMWVLVLVEEVLKATAASTEAQPLNRFWLVVLFGAWELMLAKPTWALTHGAAFSYMDRLEILGLLAAAGVAVLMHAVTAAIYAFRFAGKLWAALLVSWALHTIFNESADLLGPSIAMSGVQVVILTIILAALWPASLVRTANESSR